MSEQDATNEPQADAVASPPPAEPTPEEIAADRKANELLIRAKALAGMIGVYDTFIYPWPRGHITKQPEIVFYTPPPASLGCRHFPATEESWEGIEKYIRSLPIRRPDVGA